jgi:hypothetical protein
MSTSSVACPAVTIFLITFIANYQFARFRTPSLYTLLRGISVLAPNSPALFTHRKISPHICFLWAGPGLEIAAWAVTVIPESRSKHRQNKKCEEKENDRHGLKEFA